MSLYLLHSSESLEMKEAIVAERKDEDEYLGFEDF